jgi:Flp pilus assembly protein CpaB
MTEVQDSPVAAPTETAPPLEGGRQVRRRRGLPGGRAVVGGFLCAVAAVGVFAAYTRATAPPAVRYVVAATDVEPGRVLAASDLTLQAIDLPESLRARSFDRIDVLEGATTLAALRAGELVQASAVVDRGGVGTERIVSFAADASRSLAGAIKPGELVDVLATYGTGDSATTRIVVAGVPVLTTSASDGAIGTAATVQFSVPVPDVDSELALVHAAAVGTISVVRTIPDEGSGPRTYRPGDDDAAARADEPGAEG